MTTENFCYNDIFYSSIEELLEDIEIYEEEITNLPDDFKIKVELTVLEPVFKIDSHGLLQYFFDSNEDRFPEDVTEEFEARIKNAVNKAIANLNTELPQLYYPTGEFELITKTDLIKYFQNY